MKGKVFNNLLLFSLFGIALGFFGILYEGLVYGPKFLDLSPERMLFWKSFTTTISPIIYYAPTVYLATIVLVILYFRTPKADPLLKNRLKWGMLLQLASLALTFYILTQINFKMRFGNPEKYADTLPVQVVIFNVMSVVRIVLGAIGLGFVFRAYVQTQKTGTFG